MSYVSSENVEENAHYQLTNPWSRDQCNFNWLCKGLSTSGHQCLPPCKGISEILAKVRRRSNLSNAEILFIRALLQESTDSIYSIIQIQRIVSFSCPEWY